jgi:hypothetical protein
MQILIASVTLFAFQLSPQTPSFDKLRSDALATRRAIKSAHVVLSVEETAPTKRESLRKCEWEIWADGDKIRSDQKCTPQPDNGFRVVSIRNCERTGWGFWYIAREGYAATFAPFDQQLNLRLAAAIHPKHFGYVIDRLIMCATPGFEGAFGTPNDGSLSVVAHRYDEADCWKMSWTKGPAKELLTLSAIIDPGRGHSIVSLDFSYDAAGTKTVFRTASEIVQWGSTWYPKRITFEKILGRETVLREVVVIHSATFNEPIPAETFTRAGANLQPRPFINSPDKTETGFWEGKSISPPTPKQQKLPAPPVAVEDPSERRVNPWLLAVCGVLAVAAGFLIVRKLRARRTTP